MVLRLQAPAKINWFLSVVARREDGYHDIRSLIQGIDLYDSLIFSKADDILLQTDFDLPFHDNLVYKAAVLLREYSRFEGGCHIVLKKNIPVAAGLGGGSSDAASTLTGLNRLWELGLSERDLLGLAAQIGSDVPFFILGNYSAVEGRGEIVNPLGPGTSQALLLVKPPISVAASFAYGRCARELTKKTNDIKLLSRALEGRDYGLLNTILYNDLEEGIIREYPVIGKIKHRLIEEGAHIALMSGSGPTVFGLFDSIDEAQRVSVRMGGYWCRPVRTLN